VHPPPSPARANFTLMMECTPENSGCYSVYSVVCSFLKNIMLRVSLSLIILFGLNVDVVLVEVAEAGQPQDPRTHPQPLPPHLLLLVKTGIHFILLAPFF
jgi:hypothetical protein